MMDAGQGGDLQMLVRTDLTSGSLTQETRDLATTLDDPGLK